MIKDIDFTGKLIFECKEILPGWIKICRMLPSRSGAQCFYTGPCICEHKHYGVCRQGISEILMVRKYMGNDKADVRIYQAYKESAL